MLHLLLLELLRSQLCGMHLLHMHHLLMLRRRLLLLLHGSVRCGLLLSHSNRHVELVLGCLLLLVLVVLLVVVVLGCGNLGSRLLRHLLVHVCHYGRLLLLHVRHHRRLLLQLVLRHSSLLLQLVVSRHRLLQLLVSGHSHRLLLRGNSHSRSLLLGGCLLLLLVGRHGKLLMGNCHCCVVLVVVCHHKLLLHSHCLCLVVRSGSGSLLLHRLLLRLCELQHRQLLLQLRRLLRSRHLLHGCRVDAGLRA